ncbi:aspartate-semialdehyde dehydrogenase [Gallaecimonas sp. GXIMD1310]|uniref:aspartate-semialdehyde dehydrogenase n=1 Tax=Gallaecimonas sp. GXIMD1310 TaxID=3131926 RepID=UPI00325285DF
MTINVAILGASGAVGETLLELLEERDFPVGELHLLASSRSAGQSRSFKGQELRIEDVEQFDWSKVELAFFSAGGSVSRRWAPVAADAGVLVIDNTSEFRYQPDVPLVVPEVNAGAIADYRNRNIIANPNCSTIQMLVALKPIHDRFGISRINVATYQATSGAGRSAMEELATQTAAVLSGRPAETSKFPKQIAFNCLPQIDTYEGNGYTKEEMKMHWETQKIFADDAIAVNATCVRVPAFYGHAEAVHLEALQPVDVEEVRALLAQAPGVELVDDDDYPTQVTHAAGTDTVYVSRLRADFSHPHGLNLWIVADNVRKGAATNSVQIAEYWLDQYR